MKLLVVAGPTASGKTHLAVQLAERFHGAIISADSRQVYRGMDIGTGKDLSEYVLPSQTIPSSLIDIADPQEIYSLYRFQKDCYQALNHWKSAGRTPILCGGTGLYIEAILKQYRLSNAPEDEKFRSDCFKESHEILIQRLKEEAPDLFAHTDISSKKRVIRALEIASFRQHHPLIYSDESAPTIEPLVLVPLWERHILIERIDKRLQSRLSAGMIEEVARLLDEGVSSDRMNLFGMEYREITAYLLQAKGYEEMVDSLAQEIHQLSKRQMTWFRGMEKRGVTIHWIPNASFEEALNVVTPFLDGETSDVSQEH